MQERSQSQRKSLNIFSYNRPNGFCKWPWITTQRTLLLGQWGGRHPHMHTDHHWPHYQHSTITRPTWLYLTVQENSHNSCSTYGSTNCRVCTRERTYQWSLSLELYWQLVFLVFGLFYLKLALKIAKKSRMRAIYSLVHRPLVWRIVAVGTRAHTEENC